MSEDKKHVHFMGIGGSGMAGVAILAKAAGFKVSGCDLSAKSYYLKTLKKAKIKPKVGHSQAHLRGVDILAVSPAVFDINPNNPEVTQAKKKGILMTWQEFMGRYLQKGKFVIAVAGSHGKSTTTALVGLVLEKAGLSPTIEVGAVVPEWQATARIGSSKYFICEADEFNDNFLNYLPSLLIINNIEMDHPEFFKNFDQFLTSFEKLVKKMVGPKILIVNEDDEGVKRLLGGTKGFLLKRKYQVIGYRLGAGVSFPFDNRYQGKVLKLGESFTEFSVSFPKGESQKAQIEENFKLKLPGIHNVANALGVLACAQVFKVKIGDVKRVFAAFTGIGRRLEEIGQARGVLVIDDYAVHPTSVKATIKAARQKYPGRRIWAIFEPHQFSRLQLFKKEFASSLKLADRIIVTKIFAGREKPIGELDGQVLTEEIGSPKADYIEDFNRIAQKVDVEAKRDDVVLVFGAGESYLLSQKILKKLK